MNEEHPNPRHHRALQLFTESLECDAGEQEAWLIEQCAGDTELLDAVSKLVRADQMQSGFLEQSIQSAQRNRAGEHVGAYELLEEIGAGGMGRVYRAKRADGAFEQEVAIKLFEANHLTGAFLDRFHAERQILASLEHPAIARLIDGGDTKDGTPFVAMELIRGLPVTEYCEEAGLDFSQRLQLFLRICSAVDVAHRLGIVHRDIKPGNVMVTADGRPKIIDFGIAKVLETTEPGLMLPQTSTQLHALTPEYASPEQVQGNSVTPATDVYSLGILLYEILTGARPYQLSTLTPSEVERTICQSVPRDPSDLVSHRKVSPPRGLADASSLRRLLRGDVDRIVMTALRKEPGQRYASAAELAKDIERHLSGQPVAARGASRWYRAHKFSQRHRAAVVATFSIFMVLIGALIIVGKQAHEAQLQAARAESAKDFLIQMISSADPYENSEEPTIAGAVKQAIPAIGEQFTGQPQLEAELRYTVGFAMSGLGAVELARSQLDLALRLYVQLEDPIGQARTLTALGRVEWDESNYQKSEEAFKEALALVDGDRSAEGRKAYFDALSDLGGLMYKVDRSQEGVDLTRQALSMIGEVSGVTILNQAILWNNLAAALEGVEQYDEAIEAYQRSINLHREANDSHPDLATALGNLGMTYELIGDMDRAVAMVEQAADMQRVLLGELHPQYLLMLYNLGSLQVNAGDLESAVRNLGEAVRGAPLAYSENHLYTSRFNHRIGEVYLSLDQPELAREHAEVARGIYASSDDVPDRWVTALEKLMAEFDTDLN